MGHNYMGHKYIGVWYGGMAGDARRELQASAPARLCRVLAAVLRLLADGHGPSGDTRRHEGVAGRGDRPALLAHLRSHHARTTILPAEVSVPIIAITIIGISASPTACPSRGYGRAGTQNDRLSASAMPKSLNPTKIKNNTKQATCGCR